MFLSIIGFIFCVFIAGYITAGWYILGIFDFWGQYNIGGVPNKTLHSWLYTAIIIPIGLLWYWIFTLAPFSVSIK